jgi:sugar lactone lactonase YvrE
MVMQNNEKLKVFISYSRRDSEVTDLIVAALEEHGFEVMIDRRDLPFGEKWQQELAEFIRTSDTVIWLVSPHSVESKWCNWELDEVIRRSKRLVPVLIGDTPRDQFPRQLGEIHILPVSGLFDLGRDLDALIATLRTDRAWLKEHTRLSDQAQRWAARSGTKDLLLRGGALTAAESWKDRRPATAPAPSQDVLDLILASRRASTRRQRAWIAGSLAVAISAVALAGLAFWQRQIAITNEQDAKQRRDQALSTQSRFLADLSRQQLAGDRNDAGTAMLLALEGLPDEAIGPDGRKLSDRPHVSEPEFSLNQAIAARLERLVISGHDGVVWSVAFSPDGARILTGSADGTARLWDAATGKELARLEGHTSVVSSVAFSPDGARILTSSNDKTARLWDAATGKELARLKGHISGFSSVAFSPDGARILTGSLDSTARLWNAATGKELARLEGHTRGVWSVAFSLDGARILTGSGGLLDSHDDTARLWDAATGKELARFEGHDSFVYSVAFSPDGARILTGSNDNTVRLWDAAMGKELTRLEGHEGAVSSVAFSPDGTRILTGSEDNTARLWDAATGKELARLEGETSPVYGIAFSPDGTRLLTGSSDNMARLWAVPLRLPKLIDEAKQIAPRCLTQQHRKDFFLQPEPPRWCITGAGLEAETRADKWKPLWPYHTTRWRNWLAARDLGETPPLPEDGS